MTAALFTTRSSGTSTTATLRYFHHDHLGSIAAISNETGQVVERLAYDPWGKRRYPNGLPDSQDQLVGQNTERGYTEHEHLDEMDVIHMNGRIYDPLIGRFMSADPFIQAPFNLKSFNRYSYVWNNPLSMWDPTGYGAYADSISGAGYGTSNGSHDPAGVGGVADGSGGQIGGNAGGEGTPEQNSQHPPPPPAPAPAPLPQPVQPPVVQLQTVQVCGGGQCLNVPPAAAAAAAAATAAALNIGYKDISPASQPAVTGKELGSGMQKGGTALAVGGAVTGNGPAMAAGGAVSLAGSAVSFASEPSTKTGLALATDVASTAVPGRFGVGVGLAIDSVRTGADNQNKGGADVQLSDMLVP
jgi:RHS repeat-associated protein